MHTPAANPPWTLGSTLRLVVFLALAGAMIGQPLVRQGLERKTPKWVRSWQMFVGFGTDICDVRYAQVQPDGSRRPVQALEVLGYDSRREAPRSVWRITSEEGIDNLGRRLCRELGPGTDLRVEARCASRKGWRPTHDGSEPLCLRAEERAGPRGARLLSPASAAPPPDGDSPDPGGDGLSPDAGDTP